MTFDQTLFTAWNEANRKASSTARLSDREISDYFPYSPEPISITRFLHRLDTAGVCTMCRLHEADL